MNCENCGREHDGTYGSCRFCSRECARAFSTNKNRAAINANIKKAWQLKRDNGSFDRLYVCSECDTPFITDKPIKKGRHVHCDKCKRDVPHFLESIKSLCDLSLRTIAKLLKRANAACSTCGWNKTSLDIHHIVAVKDGGSNDDTNLITLCPNCHRMAHEHQYTKDELYQKSIHITFANWRDYYNPSAKKQKDQVA